MRFKVLHFAAGLAMLTFLAIAPGAHAEDTAPTTMLIVDGSGSMWARLGPANRAKIDIVRETLGKSLATPSSTRVGLISFGHRRRGDCNDVELIASPEADREGVLGPLAQLNPRGPGPVTAALKLAAATIGTARPAQIVFVSDGVDNCRQDPCALAADISKSSPGIPIHVVGIAIPATERARISCVATATGGHYYDIADSDGLVAALDEAVKIAIIAPGSSSTSTEPLAAVAPPPPAGASIRVSAVLAIGGALIDRPIRWRIFQAGGKDVLGATTGRDISAKLSAGAYDVEAQLGAISARKTITIADGASESIVLPLDASHLSIRAVHAKGADPSPTAILTVSSGDKPIAIGKDGSADLYVKPDDYTVDIVDGLSRAHRALKLVAGDDETIEIALETGVVELSAQTADGTAAEDVLYAIYEDDPESPNGRREVARSRNPAARFTVPAGTYYAGARSGAASNERERIAVGAGETVTKTLTLDLVPLKLKTIVAGSPATAAQGVVYRIDRLDGDRSSVARAFGTDFDTNLPPGRYKVSSSLAAFGLSASQDITLVAGKALTATLAINGGQVHFSPPANTSAGANDIFWEVTAEDGSRVWRATGAETRALLAPGHYKVLFQSQTVRLEAAFEVRSGEATEVKVGQG